MICKIWKKCKLKCEMIWKIWKKCKSNSENIWKTQKKIVKRYEKCGRTVGWIVKWYGKYWKFMCVIFTQGETFSYSLSFSSFSTSIFLPPSSSLFTCIYIVFQNWDESSWNSFLLETMQLGIAFTILFIWLLGYLKIVKWYRSYGRSPSWIVKWFGKYRRKLWNDMEHMEERQVSE
jgi:hypothetical protein